jgi:hypothetical protein
MLDLKTLRLELKALQAALKGFQVDLKALRNRRQAKVLEKFPEGHILRASESSLQFFTFAHAIGG